MSNVLNILVLGAAYGLLPAVRLSIRGHRVSVMCRSEEHSILARQGATVILKRCDGTDGRVLVVPAENGLAAIGGRLGLVGPVVDTERFDLAILAMGEHQFAAPELASLMQNLARCRIPTISVMNLPPASFLRRIESLDVEALRPAYAAWDVWQRFDPEFITAASPDAQAVRLLRDRPDLLTVTLASNIKVAPFARAAQQDLLVALADSVARLSQDEPPAPARIIAHSSLAVPLSKWPMLITGNCRCLRPDGGMRSIQEAVRADLDESHKVYDSVCKVIMAAGATAKDIVPFASYAAAARQLTGPSSLARALASGASSVERIDLLVLHSARSLGFDDAHLERIAASVQEMLDRNRKSMP